MDIHKEGLNAVVWLQTNLSSLQSCFLWFSHFGDPRNAFLLIFPLCYACHKETGVKCLWIASLTEWLNALLKWVFRDDRPYWYVESPSHLPRQDIVQFPITCETGPGFPSGHVMSISAVGLHVVLALTNYLANHSNFGNRIKQLLIPAIKLLFLGTTILVATSRVFIATHFPHQVIIAFFVGVLITIAVNRISTHLDLCNSKLCISASMLMLVVAFALHQGLVLLQCDPSATVLLAQKWCEKQSWVHLDTTPFYAIVRDAGTICGLGIANLLTGSMPSTTFNISIMQIISNIVLLCIIESINILQHSQIIFYCLAFCKFLAVPIIVVFISPALISSVNRMPSSGLVDKKD